MTVGLITSAVLLLLSGGVAGAFITGRRHIQPPTPETGWRSWDEDDENDPWTD